MSRIRPEDSAERDEHRGRHDAAVGFAPAHQHLGADDAPRAQIDHRLVVRDELAVLQRALHFDDRIGAAAPREDERQRHDHTASVAAPIVPTMRRSERAANTAARDTVAVTISG
jgi:hypothetical protein